jgi:tryptophan-rich hypothetical protein
MPELPFQPIYPRHARQLVGSKWSAVLPEERERHWEVRAFDKSSGRATLVAVLTGRSVSMPWRELRERSVWLAGWQ